MCSSDLDPSDDVIVMINPKLVKKIVIENRVERIEGFELISWINSTDEDMFVIPRNQIITMIECDKKIADYYINSLNDKNNQKLITGKNKNFNVANRQDPKSQNGFLSTTKEARVILEKIFKMY